MNPVDGAGNMLSEKDFVVIGIPAGSVYKGIVEKIKEGSIIHASKEPVIGTITIYVPITIAFDPRMPQIAQVYKIVKPPNFNQQDPS